MLSSLRRTLLLVMPVMLIAGSGCIFSPDEDNDPPEIDPDPIPQPTSPENLIEALQVIYNDKVRNSSERGEAYENLFPPEDHEDLTFEFRFQPADVGREGIPESWGRDSEIAAHRNMFRAQEDRQIHSLTLTITHLPPEDPLDPPAPGAKEIFATNVHLRLMFNPEDGLEVNGGQARFFAAPETDNSRWYLVKWEDLERP